MVRSEQKHKMVVPLLVHFANSSFLMMEAMHTMHDFCLEFIVVMKAILNTSSKQMRQSSMGLGADHIRR